MKTEKNILIAFILNLAFSIFELIGGTVSNSVAIISDAIHDIGDAISIGVSYFLEKRAKNSRMRLIPINPKNVPDMNTHGYLSMKNRMRYIVIRLEQSDVELVSISEIKI